MTKRMLAVSITLSFLLMGIALRPVCSFAENDEDDFWGIGLYYDSDFLKRIGKNAFKKIHKKATAIVPKKMKKKYSKLLRQAGFRGTIKAI